MGTWAVFDEQTNLKIDAVRDFINEKQQDIWNLEGAFDRFITDLPEENFSRWQEWYAPVHADIQEFRDEYIEPALTYLNEIVDEILRRPEKPAVTWADFMATLANWPDMLSGIYFDSSDVGAWNQNLFSYLVSKAGDLTEDQIAQSVAARLEAPIEKPVIPLVEYASGDGFEPVPISTKPPATPPAFSGDIYSGIATVILESTSNPIMNAAKEYVL